MTSKCEGKHVREQNSACMTETKLSIDFCSLILTGHVLDQFSIDVVQCDYIVDTFQANI